MINASLFGVRVRLADGTVGVIVVPRGLVSVESVIMSTQAVMNITAIASGEL